MSHNTFGHLFRVTTWGESHGPAIGCVVDGCPPGLALDAAMFAHDLERRATGRSRHQADVVRLQARCLNVPTGAFAHVDVQGLHGRQG